MVEKLTKSQIPKEDLKKYITGDDPVAALNFAEIFAKYLYDSKFTINKLRTFFGEVDTIETKVSTKRIALLKPKLAYLVGRENKWNREPFELFKDVMEVMINELLKPEKKDIEEHYSNFVNFVKAVVAYYKFHEKK